MQKKKSSHFLEAFVSLHGTEMDFIDAQRKSVSLFNALEDFNWPALNGANKLILDVAAAATAAAAAADGPWFT